MTSKSTNTDPRSETKNIVKATGAARFSTPDRTTAVPTPRPAIDDDDAQWVTQRMFDHYNG